MKLYAHRGNVDGSKPCLENTIWAINNALRQGYYVEVDIRFKDGEFVTGHDEPVNIVTREFLEDSRILVHAKDMQTFQELLKYKTIHSFYQSYEDIVVSSQDIKIFHEKSHKISYLPDEIYVNLDGTIAKPEAYGCITDYPERLKKHNESSKIFKLLILDVDGVMTDGTKTYDVSHNVISKRYCDKDFTAIKRFIAGNVPVVLLSGCEFNEGMAAKRGIPFYNAKKLSNQLDKTVGAKIICESNKVRLEDVGYVGDDYYDLSLLSNVNWSYCPSDATEIVKRNVKTVLPRKGGAGVIEALYELVSNKIPQRFPYE